MISTLMFLPVLNVLL